MANNKNGLIGKKFLTPDFDKAGTVLAQVEPGIYLVCWVNWFYGGDSVDQKLIRVEEMLNWIFFNCIEDANSYVPYKRHLREIDDRLEKGEPLQTDASAAALLKKLDGAQ